MADSVRLDKWLWAARFFKTRGLARAAIDGGHVHINGHRAKPSKAVEVGMTLSVSKGQSVFDLVVNAVSAQRRGAPEAQLLYTETEDSQAKRKEQALRRAAQSAGIMAPSSRPSKKDRREIHRFQRQEEP
ncbi:RNA-binding S4 domain-containing protein [Litorivicinus lipolyticus]|uniref:RNA-binding S4 domain-containing protein n=1 Tax=Litorivicinus lipolyticus TaxID=418701 RepID=UPI003B5B9ADA